MKKLFLKLIFVFFFSSLTTFIICLIFKPVFCASSLFFPYAITPFDICAAIPLAWKYIKILYIICFYYSCILFFNYIFHKYFSNLILQNQKKFCKAPPDDNFQLFVGYSEFENTPIFIPETGLFQNILITGTIGTGKTSSSMYPFTDQLIKYSSNFDAKKFGMLILDVKGNYYKQVKLYCELYERTNDLIIIELGTNVKYNPLDKPNLKSTILANRSKTILTLFSSNNSDSYWLDKAEQVLSECIKLCRLYNNGYVTFVEIHKLITSQEYYFNQLVKLRSLFQSGKLSNEDIYNLNSAITFFENEFCKLDSRVLSILKSEITRITNTFISDYDVLNTFRSSKESLTFNGFSEVLKEGKIVVLNMNISKYKNLAKILAAYLKLDFQTEILTQLSTNSVRPSCFICDEYHEYVTSTDADFFAQSREAKCINIVATQSYTSLLNTLKDQSSVKVIVQNLINKLWFRTDDIFTIEDAQKQIGKEEKIRTSKSISENSGDTNFNYFTNSLNSKNSGLSESISTYTNLDFVYDTNFFTQKLETFTCLSFLSDGNKVLKPQKIKMCPYFKNNIDINIKKNKSKII